MKNFLTAIVFSIITTLAVPSQAATVILAGGCFWCVESDFEKLDGVTDAVSGFTGGSHPNPTYNGRHDGHYEAVLITYDPEIIDYQGILDHFWVNHDPFDDGGQFCDRGHEYKAAIFVANEDERAAAEASKQAVAAQFPDLEVVTPILERSSFFPIKGSESYHQDYYKKNPIRYNFYRTGCGRDRILKSIWGDKATVK